MATAYTESAADAAAVVQRPSSIPAAVAPRSTLVSMPGLRYWRIARTLTQEELGELAGLNRVTVGRLETGTPARLTTVRRLAAALEVQPSALTSAPPTE